MPVSASSTAAYCPVRPMRLRTAGGVGDDVVPEHGGPARVGPQQGGEHADGGGLARPVGAEQAEHRAGPGDEVDAVERGGGAEALDQAFDADCSVHDPECCAGPLIRP